ncbi:polyketide synthase [Larkinella terrae]|uniref:Amino acid adenylation domain-containing protein n=1 Tax=Larkinella terrae TaxID=2025311 RepID=A0A7K0EVY3_9BACT|nr:polyketide synthase [Larkinella terrae]MRS65578.1 amino acid adenylation domain-containing protein [Larkinella terrae]
MHSTDDFEALQEKNAALLLHQLVAQQATKTPEAIAVLDATQAVSFAELNRRSSQLAQFLLIKGVEKEQFIGVCLDRSVEMVMAVLAVLKAGCAFVPIDPNYPAERLNYIVTDTAMPLILCSRKTRSKLANSLLSNSTTELQEIDYSNDTCYINSGNTTPVLVSPSDLAYVIYTSGSTGKPKGVLIEHRSLSNYIQSSIQHYSATNSQHSGSYFHLPLTFDASLTALFVPLLTGKTIVISPAAPLDVFNDSLFIQQAPFDFLKLTPAQFLLLESSINDQAKWSTRTYVVGGEALHQRHFQFLIDHRVDAEIINEYGPTEATVGCISYRFHVQDPVPVFQNGLLIGKPMPNVSIYLLNESLQPVPVGSEGEIYIGGVQVARGYLNNEPLTNQKFLADPFANEPGARMYKSGDLGRWHPDGNIEYLGRIDEQVKIQGFRIELGEIENALIQYPGIIQCVAHAVEGSFSEKRLVVYYLSDDDTLDKNAVFAFLKNRLPDFMIPSLLVKIDTIPLSANGKVDRKLLPKPETKRSELNDLYIAPITPTEKKIALLWASLLQLDKVGLEDNFFELGGTSILSIKCISLLKQQFQRDISVTKIYQHPTVKTFSLFIDDGLSNGPKTINSRVVTRQHSEDVAVIGMAGRFPGANTIPELWELLKQGRETTRFFTEAELDASIPDAIKNAPNYVKARGVLSDADQFDAAFFGLSPRLAEVMDPQQRIFLEIAWEVLEQTGYLLPTFADSIGVFAGCGNNTYYLNNVHGNQQVMSQIGGFQAMTVNEKDYIASRTAYQLNLKGPAVSVYSACSTSLLAITLAVESIRNGQCELALAGGSSITAPINSGHLYEEGTMLSRDGHCRSFDADASGTVFSDGAGVVLLKNLEAARQDGDMIYAVIKGVGVNNDGAGKGSFTAPNTEGQAGAIAAAIADARIDPATIQYVEAHGTATPLGDPIEIEGLKMAFGPSVPHQYCAIGSIKSNMGHLTAAAGVAGFIKTALALHHRLIPPSLGFSKPNPHIDFATSPFYVNTALTEWKSDQPRRAGVSSFGVGGTNVHVVLEESDYESPTSSPGRDFQLLTWSAKTAASREAYAFRLANYLKKNRDTQLVDLAFTLQTTRPDFNHRRFLVLPKDTAIAENRLLTDPDSSQQKTVTEKPGEVVFLFPGQGAQYLNMGRQLYETEAVFRQAVDACANLLEPYLPIDIRDIIYAQTTDSEADEQLRNTRFTQPALFVTEYALAQLWISWGIEPGIFCGHSIGEFVGAHLAGIFSLADALKLIAIRGQLVSELPTGDMLSVRLEAETLQKILPETLSIAAINSPKLCVVAGPPTAIASFSELLNQKEIPNRLLLTSHAFHSAMMDPIVETFREVVASVPHNRPRKPIISTVSGTWLTDAQGTDPTYWANHLRQTVRFADAMQVVSELDNPLCLEVGPGNVTSTLARQHPVVGKHPVVASLGNSKGVETEVQAILHSLGQLWISGLQPDWNAFYARQNRVRLSLPTYAFDRKRCWLDPPKPATATLPSPNPTESVTDLSVPPVQNSGMRKTILVEKVKELLEEASGIEMEGAAIDRSFLEMGLDSLLLTQVAIILKKEFGLPITFRQLNDEFTTLDQLATYLDQQLPASAYQPAPVTATPASTPSVHSLPNTPTPNGPSAVSAGNDSAIGLIAQQLQILAKQVALLEGGNHSPLQTLPPAPPVQVSSNGKHTPPKLADLTPEEAIEIKKPFGATARIDRQVTELTPRQQRFLQDLTARYNLKTGGSKAYSQKHRAAMADPRVVSGFKPLTKEIVYPLVVNKSKGSRLWDIDGNEYIDALNGFGSNLFGYQPNAIKETLHEQIELGFEIGPQHELAGEVCDLICEFTGMDRSALCSTGSEAVLGTMRIARTVTGRSLIVAFTGSYHGIVDEVIVRGTRKLKSFPAASGIMPEAVQNMLILDYGTEESLQIIRERAHELAAVLVEPVQSRRPEFQPVAFLKEVRAITAASGTALIFDEVISGFRMHPGGAQALFGIKADLASYGKVVGGGLPIGVIAGKKEFMDALDGGFWQYGDASFPEIGVTYFAGTFVRHPLALAAAKASLNRMKELGPELQKGLTRKAVRIAETLNAEFRRQQLPFFVAQFGSLWKLKFNEEIPYSELLFTLMREKGIHIWDGFPCFITAAHSDKEIDQIIVACLESVNELTEAGFFVKKSSTIEASEDIPAYFASDISPVPGAKLGRDRNGNPGWFIENPDQPGKYMSVELK